jgi:methyltransferase-like protein/trans-aconitate methyltransferase
MESPSDQIVEATAKSYDDLPYDSMAFDYTQPEHVAAIGILMGMQVPELSKARILEIGCASGGNLVNFAAKHADAYCLGVDISKKQIDDGRAFVAACGITNLHLEAMDIRDLPDDTPKFDFIICHGVLAWVPEDVQHGILASIQSLLSQQGIAYISYNVYPAWHAMEVGRHLMYRATAHLDNPNDKLRVAEEAIQVFANQANNTPDRPIAQLLKERIKKLENSPRYYIYHEYLEPCNSPFYFRDFVALCAGHKLQYLADTTFAAMFLDSYGEQTDAVKWIRANARNRYDEEEYMDYLSGRTFRRSLMVHNDVQLNLAIQPERLNLLNVYSNFQLATQQPKDGNTRFNRYDNENINLNLSDPFSVAVMTELSLRIPHPIDLPSLLMLVWKRCGEDFNLKKDHDIVTGLNHLASFLLNLMKKEVVQVYFQPLVINSQLSDKPVAWRVAQVQASMGQVLLSNFYCKMIQSDSVMNAVIALATGENSLATIKQTVAKSCQVKQSEVQAVLERLSRTGFFVG